DRTSSQLPFLRWRLRFCASCARDSMGRRANVAPGKFVLFASCSPDVSREGRVQIVFCDNRALRVNYFEFSRRGVAAFESRPAALDEGPLPTPRLLLPGVLNERLSGPITTPSFPRCRLSRP